MINKSNSLVILDWDNTLFPSTWVTKNFINLNNIINNNEERKKYLNLFAELDDLLVILFQNILEQSNLIIVTNAMPVWIKISSSILPKTKYLLNNIKVVSARKNHGSSSSDATEWKKLSFIDEVANIAQNPNISVVSIGDASYEYNALINLYNKNRILKSVKFIEEPSFEILKDQIRVLNNNNHIKKIIMHKGHLDLVYKIRT